MGSELIFCGAFCIFSTQQVNRAKAILALSSLSALAGCGATQALGPAHVVTNATAAVRSSSERVLYGFTGGNDGGDTASAIALDASGNLYGTTVLGGTANCGTVFKLTPQASPPWPESVLYAFSCYGDGKNPYGGVTFDASGNLDGTTVAGGNGGCSDGCGVVFTLTPSSERVLHAFAGGTDGFGPGGGVTFDRVGNAFGTTPDGGKHSAGIVYEVSRHASSRERIVHAFTGGSDGGTGSLGSLLVDETGAIYGTAETGGAHGWGTAFKISRAKNRFRFTTLYAFAGSPDAASPYGGLVADSAGNLYGTTYYGGAANDGALFELQRGARGYRERVLYSFGGGSDGSNPTSTLAFGSASHLYGTTSAGGGACNCGTIFEFDAASGKERVRHRFGSGTDGAFPYYGLTKSTGGAFYGTTVAGGNSNAGTVFEFTESSGSN
jgi:uncharacterized repeat protein (TIGR03803 family)